MGIGLLLLLGTSVPCAGDAGAGDGGSGTSLNNGTVQTETVRTPERAAMLSATLPGLGQVYNGRYWKVPIIYAGFGTLAYFLNMNSREYQRWRTAYIARVDGNPNTVDGYPHSTDQLERAMRVYRRNLEVTYLLGAALYILNILDANVDAHLLDFDVREDLGLRMQPIVNQLPCGRSGPGLSLTITF